MGVGNAIPMCLLNFIFFVQAKELEKQATTDEISNFQQKTELSRTRNLLFEIRKYHKPNKNSIQMASGSRKPRCPYPKEKIQYGLEDLSR